MRPDAIAEILELTSPPALQRDDEFTIQEWITWMSADGQEVKLSTARRYLMLAVERGELATRQARYSKGYIRVFSKVIDGG